MIHSRLRRSLRLAVDLLPLNLAGYFISSHCAPLLSRGSPASAPAILVPLAPTRTSSSAILAVRPPRRSVGAHGRRYLASTALLLALALEVCGCDPVGSSDLASDSLDFGRGAPPTVRAVEDLSFYDPDDRPALPSSSSLPLDDRTPGERPLPNAPKSAPWAIPESVYLLYRSRRPGEAVHRQTPLATAFVVAVPALDQEGVAPGSLVRFLVTARHVLDPEWARCAERNPASIDLRLNRRSGGVGFETLSLQTGAAPRFFTPSDPTADLAVILLDYALIPNLDDYKFLDVPFHLLLTSSDLPLIQLEQPVMTAGLSTVPLGGSASFPVFDAGSLSEMPAQPVDVRCGMTQHAQTQAKLLHVWFINAGLPPGVSGAPVFTSIAPGPDPIKGPVLLGVQSVVWPNKGMAGITPSPILADLIRTALHQTLTKPGHLPQRSPARQTQLPTP